MMSKRKKNALGLYMEGIRDGKPEQALDKYTGARYTQHSTGVANGKEGFLAFFKPFLERTPDRDIRVIRSIEDGPFVFCHVFQSLNGGTAKWVTMDLFDTDADGRIIEHWDVIAAYEESSAAEGDMIGGPIKAKQHAKTAANKSLVKEYVKRVLTEGRHDELDQFVSENLIQRAPGLAPGRDGLSAALDDGRVGACEMLFQLIGEGNFVVTLTKMRAQEKDFAAFDIYRIEQKRIVEHWEVREEILPRSQWGNSGKF